MRKSSILKVTYNYVYSPFLVYMGLTVIHHGVHLVRDILSLFHSGKEVAK